MSTLGVIIASTRPGRAGRPVGRWAAQTATSHGGFRVEVADLAELALPMMDEPHHPRLGEYVHEHTRRWSRLVDAAGAFVFVTPEYNHGPAASLLNAISYLDREWLYKPVGFVSYGGASGGMRGVEALKPIVSREHGAAVRCRRDHPHQAPDRGRRLHPLRATAGRGAGMLGELLRWTEALQGLRDGGTPARSG